MTTQLRDGSTVTDPRFDRIPDLAESNRGYTVERFLADVQPQATRVRRSRGHRVGPGLNQGNEGQCVLYACTHRRNSTPKPLRPAHEDRAEMSRWYHDVQHADQWRGCSRGAACPIQPDPRNAYEGTSVRSAMDYGRAQGWWESFWWVGAGSGDVGADIIHANATIGGIVYGLDWFHSMFEPRPSGLLEVDPSSGLGGGHAVYSPAVRLKMRLPSEWKGTKEVVVVQQSWGERYGVADLGRPGGFVYILLEDLVNKLMSRRGEGAVVVR